MREAELYAPMVRGAADEGWVLFHPQEGAAKAPFDLCGVVTAYVTFGGRDAAMRAVGVAVACEVKLVDRQPREGEFPWRLLEAHQRTWIETYAGAGSVSLVALCGPAHDMVVYVVGPGPVVVGSAPLEWRRLPDRFTGWGTILSLWAARAPSEAKAGGADSPQ